MALSSTINSMIDRSNGLNGPGDGARANYLYSASGLAADELKVQAGEVYVTGVHETTATGYYTYHYPINAIPRVQVTWAIPPSGLDLYVSASGEDHFVLTFVNSTNVATPPFHDDDNDTVPAVVATWLAII